MSDPPSNPSSPSGSYTGSSKTSASFRPPVEKISEEEAEALFLRLRRKEGGWIAWGRACETLQKSGYSTQQIFEETGFEAVHQLQVSVAAKVYDSLTQQRGPERILEHYQQKGSDILYELRQLDAKNRLKAAAYCLERGLDMDEARAVAKDFRELQWLSSSPPDFENEPGDAVAYFCWKRARGRKDLQARSRLIAQGLRYAQSASARKRLETLLTDFAVVTEKKAPLLPLYRLEQEEELPRLIPVAGQFPLDLAALEQIPDWREEGAFRVVQGAAGVSWVALPGWQMILRSQQPVAFHCSAQSLPSPPEGLDETVLVVVDRSETDWSDNSYYLTEKDGQLALSWFAETPAQPLLGKVVVIIRPKRILDEGHITQPWQLE